MDRQKHTNLTDLDLLSRLRPLSFLSPLALRELANGLHPAVFKRREVILPEGLLASGLHILLRGVAKITCLNQHGRRIIAALVAPGPILEFPSLLVSGWQFRCEAQSNCGVGSLSWDQFDIITRAIPQAALREFHENNLMRWYRLFAGNLRFLGLNVRERLEFTLRQLSLNFGVVDSRGVLLGVPLSHTELADLVGATRPRVTEHLAELEREHFIIRQGRQLIVCLNKTENAPRVRAGALPYFRNESQHYGRPSLAAIASVIPAKYERRANE